MTLSARQRRSLLKWLCLAPIPIVWCVLAYFGSLGFLEDKLLDWRFRYRGPVAAPVRVVYVDIDSTSINVIGNWPWDRAILARTCKAVEKAGVKAIGLDLVLSDLGQAQIVDPRTLVRGNEELFAYAVRQPPPPIVLGASFTAADFYDQAGKLSHRELPIVATEKRPLKEIEGPEVAKVLRRYGPGVIEPTTLGHEGLIDTLNGQARWVPIYAPSNVGTFYNMGAELARLYLGVSSAGMKVEDGALVYRDSRGEVLRRVPLSRGQFLEVNWFGPWMADPDPHVSFVTVFANAENLMRGPARAGEDAAQIEADRKQAEAFFAQPMWKDAVVLIGPVDKLLHDLLVTPVDAEPVPGVGIHGNVVKTILSGLTLHRPPFAMECLLIVGLTLAITVMALYGGTRSAFAKTAAVLLAAGYVAVAFELFRRYQWVLPIASPVGAAFTTSFGGLIWQVVEEERQKSRIKGMFGTYLSPTVVQELVESGRDPELGGHDAEITAYFSDIQSFSSFSEVMKASSLGELLNEYLSACTEIVQAEAGTLDKYIGDAVVAMYGAPVAAADHAYRACVASQRVHRRLAELREKWRAEGARWPGLVHELQTRIGLNTGVCMIGNMGSHARFNYTMMGDNVNLAARMESGAKSWGVYTMCTEATRVACEQHGPGKVIFRPLGRIVVKGRTQPVPIHEIVGLAGEVDDRTLECIAEFGRAMERMYARDWRGALELFEKSASLEPTQPGRSPGVKSNASLMRMEKVRHYLVEPPPAEWDGVEVMTEK